MQHMVVDLGHQPRGAAVQISLSGNAANVWLMDSSTYSRYKRGRQVRAQGGHTKRSPVVLQTTSSGRWYAVADLGGYPGRLGMGAIVLPGAAAPLRQMPNVPRGSVVERFAEQLPDDARDDTHEVDVFISHATEDKDEFVRPLAQALVVRGVVVWYDEFELRIGDSLRRKIDSGIARSRFGLVVLSRSFLAKNWPQYELDGLVARNMHDGSARLLPVWHGLHKDELVAKSPSLADRVALDSEIGVEEIARQIAEVVHPSGTSHAGLEH